MASDPKFYDGSDVLLSAPVPISANTGTPGAAVTLQLINAKGGSADDFIGVVRFYFRDAVESDADASGDEWADNHYVEVRQEAGGWNNTLSQGDWIRVGAGAPLPVPQLAQDKGVKWSVRLSAPGGAKEATKEIEPRIEESKADATSIGISESAGFGIYAGLRDKAITYQVAGGAITEDSPQSRDVKLPNLAWVARGKPYAVLAQDVTLAVAASGKERFDLLSLAADGSGVIVTAGAEVTAPAADSDKPALPAGNLPLCYVRINDGAVEANIVDADIEQAWALSLYALSSTSLTATIARGPHAIIQNAMTRNLVSQNATLTASSTNYIWLRRDGSLEVTVNDPVPPQAGSLLLWEADTDGSSVTASRDRRHLIGHESHVVEFRFPGEIFLNNRVYSHLPGGREALVLPLRPVVGSLGTSCTGTGLSGEVEFDIEVEDPPSTWTSIFGTKPGFAVAEADPITDAAAVPIVRVLPGGARIRCTCSALPTPEASIDDSPQDATITLPVAL